MVGNQQQKEIKSRLGLIDPLGDTVIDKNENNPRFESCDVRQTDCWSVGKVGQGHQAKRIFRPWPLFVEKQSLNWIRDLTLCLNLESTASHTENASRF